MSLPCGSFAHIFCEALRNPKSILCSVPKGLTEKALPSWKTLYSCQTCWCWGSGSLSYLQKIVLNSRKLNWTHMIIAFGHLDGGVGMAFLSLVVSSSRILSVWVILFLTFLHRSVSLILIIMWDVPPNEGEDLGLCFKHSNSFNLNLLAGEYCYSHFTQ